MSSHLSQAFLDELKSIMEDEYPSLVETFLRESAMRFAEANANWHARELDGVRRNAHSLKGSAANVGAQHLQHTCGALEHSAGLGEVQKIPELLRLVGAELDHVRKEIVSA